MKLREISIADLLKEKSEKFGDKLFIDNPEYTCTYRELDYYTDIVAKKLLDDGVNTILVSEYSKIDFIPSFPYKLLYKQARAPILVIAKNIIIHL